MRPYVLGLALLAGALSACSAIPNWLRPMTPLPGGAVLMEKEVEGKEGPSTLYAFDGTICQVSPRRFEKAVVGQRFACAWREAGGPARGRRGIGR